MQHRIEQHPGHRGLHLAVHRFGPPTEHVVLLLHGFMDAGGTWDLVARHLVPRGLHLVAPDQRGFGASDRVGPGGYYHFPDYVADVDRLVHDVLDTGQRLSVVGHSMGGTVASLFCGSRPDRIHRLVLMEGVGPPAMPPEVGVQRMRSWLDQGLKPESERTALESEDDALSRLQFHHRRVPAEVLKSRIPHLSRRDDTGMSWCYDPQHRRTSPHRFDVETFRAFAAQVHCPVRFVSGGSTGFHPADEPTRLAAFPHLVDQIEIPDAGHMMHWTRPEASAEAIGDFVTS